MNAEAIVTIYVVIDNIVCAMNIQDDSRTQMRNAEILTVAVVAAQQFQNHHERALSVLHLTGFIAQFSVSRFNRRLHVLKDVLSQVLLTISELLAWGELFIVDALSIPVCKWVRSAHCRELAGKEFVGYCVSKSEYVFGWHLHLVCDQHGIPVSFDLLPARSRTNDGLAVKVLASLLAVTFTNLLK